MLIAKGLLCILAVQSVRCAASALEEEDLVVKIFSSEINSWARSGYQTRTLDEIVNALALPNELRRLNWRTLTGTRANLICTVCKSFARSIISLRNDRTPVENIQRVIVNLCTRLNIQPERVCQGIVDINTPIIFYIIDSDPNITADDICGVALQDRSCTTAGAKYEWSIEIDSSLPKISEEEKGLTEETVKILQITDIHFDPLYEPNGNSHCDEPTCCRKGQNVTNTSGKLAGYWGDYNDCDSPWHAVQDTLDHIRNVQRDIDYVYFTGDVIDHGVWETSRRRNTESLMKSYDLIKDTFQNTPVYPLIGNHEPHPLNNFAPSHITNESLSTEWLFTLMADMWIDYGWLPESTRETILRGGFYTISPRKGFRIIALNNNVCYTYNWWLLYDPQDPSGQLLWLFDTLLEAELNEERVHILAHVPPRSQDCYIAWSNEFRRIVNRFAHVITGQFNGHTHFDEFNVFYDPTEPGRAINVAWNGGSVTPFSNLNPNYKVYTTNANTFAVVDIDNWMYNLTRANETPEKRPEWYRSYSFREEYGLKSLTPAALGEWVVDMSKDVTKLDTYHKNFHKHADTALSTECGEDCLRNYLCDIVTTSANDRTQCDYLMNTSR